MSDTPHPAGKTCRDCKHFTPKCEWFISYTGDETECDWYPSKFVDKNTGAPAMKVIHPEDTARLVEWALERWRAGEAVEGCVSRIARPGTLVTVSTPRLDGRGVLHMLVADSQEAVDAALRVIHRAAERDTTPGPPR